MWQKKLKTLKQQAPIKSKTTTAPTTMPKEQEISFAKYCQEQHIRPIIQDTVSLKTKPRININLSNITPKTQSFDYFDEASAANELFRFGQRKLPKELRLGKYKIHTTLDLHHVNKDHALFLLEQLIDSSPSNYCLKIIHGKGLNSANPHQPVLLGAVRKFLQYHQRVLAYSYALPKQGGNGVTLVLLRN